MLKNRSSDMDQDPTPTAFTAVLFDLDGVVTDTAEQHYLGWQRLADEEGLPFDRAANEALRGVSRAESLALIVGDREVPDARREAMMARKNDYYVASLADLGPDDALPGARELIAACRERGLRIAIASSSRNARTVLSALGLLDAFDAIADGASVANAKPAPDLFLHAAGLLGAAPARCVVLEDARSGVDAALAAGMRAVGIGPADRVGHAHLRYDEVADVDLGEVLAP
jgi:beta-phosphoglucomutase